MKKSISKILVSFLLLCICLVPFNKANAVIPGVTSTITSGFNKLPVKYDFETYLDKQSYNAGEKMNLTFNYLAAWTGNVNISVQMFKTSVYCSMYKADYFDKEYDNFYYTDIKTKYPGTRWQLLDTSPFASKEECMDEAWGAPSEIVNQSFSSTKQTLKVTAPLTAPSLGIGFNMLKITEKVVHSSSQTFYYYYYIPFFVPFNATGNVSAPDCTIGDGASSCISKITWNAKNIYSRAYLRDPFDSNSMLDLLDHGDETNHIYSYHLKYNTPTVFSVYSGGSNNPYYALIAQSKAAIATCSPGTSWNGSICFKSKGTNTLTASDCTIKAGDSWCYSNINWSSSRPDTMVVVHLTDGPSNNDTGYYDYLGTTYKYTGIRTYISTGVGSGSTKYPIRYVNPKDVYGATRVPNDYNYEASQKNNIYLESNDGTFRANDFFVPKATCATGSVWDGKICKGAVVNTDGGWSSWTIKDTTCGVSGTITRTCNNPAPTGTGTCTLTNGTKGLAESQAYTNAVCPPAPTAKASASPTTTHDKTDITWSSTNASSCSCTIADSGADCFKTYGYTGDTKAGTFSANISKTSTFNFVCK